MKRMLSGLALCLAMLIPASLTVSAADVEVYGFIVDTGSLEYRVIYDPNGGDGGFTGEAVRKGGTDTVLSLADTGISREGYDFTGWNTEAGGSGTHYAPGDGIVLADGDVVLYAQWQETTPDNSSPGGEVLSSTDSPKTGDMGHMTLWYGLLLVSLCTLLLLYAERRRKHRKPQTQRV